MPDEMTTSLVLQINQRIAALEAADARRAGKDSGERIQVITEARVREIIKEAVEAEARRIAEAQVKTDLTQSTEIQDLKKRMGLIQTGISTLITLAGTAGPGLLRWLKDLF